MRLAFGLFLAIFLANAALASHAKKKHSSTCFISCADDYKPLCAKAKNDAPERFLTFGNYCAMNHYNCQHSKDPYVVKFEGECGGNVTIRLV